MAAMENRPRRNFHPAGVEKIASASSRWTKTIPWSAWQAAHSPIIDGNVWELHPLVVKKSEQRRGIGRRLVAIERRPRKGAVTMMLGFTDDETGATSLSGTDLYEPVERIAHIRNLHDHPYSFYENAAIPLSGWCRMRTDTAARIS